MDVQCLKFYEKLKIDLLDVVSSSAPTHGSLNHNDEYIRAAGSNYEQRVNDSARFYDPEIVIQAGQVSYFASRKIWKTSFIKRINLENGSDHEIKKLAEYFDKRNDPVPVLFTGKIIDNNFLGYCPRAEDLPSKRGFLRGVRPWNSRYLIEVLIFDKLFYVLNRALFFLLLRNSFEFDENWSSVLTFERYPDIPEEYKTRLNKIVFTPSK